MGILDDAIRDHLDLKRKHGARDTEISDLEADAFGGGDRPDSFGTADMLGEPAPGSGAPQNTAPEIRDAAPQGSEDPTMLVEPQPPAPRPSEGGMPLDSEIPAPSPTPPEKEAPPAGPVPPEPPAPVEAPPAPEAPPDAEAAPPPGPQRSVEPASVQEPSAAAPPPESESLEELLAQEDESTTGAAATVPPASTPADEAGFQDPEDHADGIVADPGPAPPEASEPEASEPEASEPEASEPEASDYEAPESEDYAGVPEPPPPPPEPGTEPPGRARGRVHHPTEEWHTPDPPSEEVSAPLEPEPASRELDHEQDHDQAAPVAGGRPQEPTSDEGPALFDFETDAEMDLREAPAAPPDEAPESADEDDDFEELGPVEQDSGLEDDRHRIERDEPAEDPFEPVEAVGEDPGAGADLLAASPEFADGEDDEDLWFEKGPPQDFDFEEKD